MSTTGKYMYGVISTESQQNFGDTGLQKQPVSVVVKNGLAIVVSDIVFDGEAVVTGTRRNMLAHQKTIEQVMASFTIAPFSFGTVASNEQEVMALLENRNRELSHILQSIEGKIELGVKVMWTDMQQIYTEISEESSAVKQLKAHIQKTGDQSALLEVGKRVEQALLQKKSAEAQPVLEFLKAGALEFTVGKNLAEPMFLNASFLINKTDEKAFDRLVEQIAEKTGSRAQFKYVGPLAPYSFIDMDMELQPEEAGQ